jgi:predicted nuclease of predicted toxin-antitoxin system
MPVTFYMDHHVPRAITLGLRLRETDVITAYEDGTSELDDAGVMDRASELGRVLFTRDDDLLAEATRRQREGIPFDGVVYAHQLRVSIGRCVEDLELIAKAGEPVDDESSDVLTALKAGKASRQKPT